MIKSKKNVILEFVAACIAVFFGVGDDRNTVPDVSLKEILRVIFITGIAFLIVLFIFTHFS